MHSIFMCNILATSVTDVLLDIFFINFRNIKVKQCPRNHLNEEQYESQYASTTNDQKGCETTVKT